MQTSETLFLYGSWHPGYVHFQLLEPYVEEIRSAHAHGTVYRSTVGYPIFVNEGHDLVPGGLVQLRAPAFIQSLLDQFHGFSAMNPETAAYTRVTAKVLTGAEVSEASIYAMPKQNLPRHFPRIPGGDWLENLRQRPDLVSMLPQEHRLYLERLRASNGREGLPKDLNLYRDLLKRELIIDRGRSVGLTKLGQEVVKYLPQNVQLRH